MNLSRLISILHNQKNSYMNVQLKEFGLSHGQAITLKIIYEENNIKQEDLNKRLQIDKSAVTRILKTLEDKGFIIKKTSKEDKRNHVLSLTSKGKELYPKIKVVIKETTEMMIKDIDQNELILLEELLLKMKMNLEDTYENEDKMGTKNILPLLVEFSIPAIIGMLVNAIYNIVDRMFIGNAPELGAIGLAGISICYPVTLVLMAISLMIGMGGATRFSIALGQGKKEEAGKYMGNGLTLTIILGLVFMILGNVFLAPMLRLLGASKTVLPYAENYLSIILYGAVFQCNCNGRE